MELLNGMELEKALERGALQPDRVDHIVGQICGSLQEAHDKGSCTAISSPRTST